VVHGFFGTVSLLFQFRGCLSGMQGVGLVYMALDSPECLIGGSFRSFLLPVLIVAVDFPV